ncbi:MAG: ASCH domain-containing protein [Candidatus Methanomethylicaceae archaeon]
MKALSIQQPWAWLIVMGYKDIENRSWPTTFRERFLIHASKKFDHAGYNWLKTQTGLSIPTPDECKRGGIVGMAEIIDCVTYHNSPWFFGPYGFILKNARPLPFVPLQGKLGFFEVDDGLLRQMFFGISEETLQ